LIVKEQNVRGTAGQRASEGSCLLAPQPFGDSRRRPPQLLSLPDWWQGSQALSGYCSTTLSCLLPGHSLATSRMLPGYCLTTTSLLFGSFPNAADR
jgi:hypothetical protein